MSRINFPLVLKKCLFQDNARKDDPGAPKGTKMVTLDDFDLIRVIGRGSYAKVTFLTYIFHFLLFSRTFFSAGPDG